MSQDSNSNLFNGHPHFHASPFDPNLYPDMSMQFAASVPRRPEQTQPQNHLSMNFGPGGAGASFHNSEVMMQPHSNSTLNYYGSPYERPEPPSQGKQQHQSKAERRAEHNAIERLRRENLNVKFQQLAFALPNLQNDTRPSKSTIIDRTLDFVKGAILKEDRMQYRIQELEKFNRYLLAELDKKNGTKSSTSPPVSTQEELVERATSTVKEETPSPVIQFSPANSVISDDSYNNEFISLSSPPPLQPPQQKQSRKSNKRRSVSHSSVSMIPKLEYNSSTTNWPTTITTTITTSSPTIAASNQHMMLEQSNFDHMQQFQHQDFMSRQQPTVSNKECMFDNAQPMFNFNMNSAPFMNNHLQLQHRR